MSHEVPFIDFITFEHEKDKTFLKKETTDKAGRNARRIIKVAQKEHKEETEAKPLKVAIDKLQFDDCDLFDEVFGIKVYNGMVEGDEDKFSESIELYRDMCDNEIMTIPKSSTISVTGKLSHIIFNEKGLATHLLFPENPRILKIGCNDRKILQLNYQEKYHEKKKKAALRKAKRQSGQRPKKGGGYFPSCIQFDILADDMLTVFKIKLFRTGTVQIPGVKDSLMRDAIPALVILRDYMRNLMENPKIDIVCLTTNMRNYISQLRRVSCGIFVEHMQNLMMRIKTEFTVVSTAEMWMRWQSVRHLPREDAWKQLMDAKITNIKINEISLNEEKRPGLYIKFNRPIKHNADKQLTIKVLKSGKIDFDGASHDLEVREMFQWVVFLVTMHWGVVVFDPETATVNISSDSDDYPAIYDDDIPA
jgi:hypothetical protein